MIAEYVPKEKFLHSAHKEGFCIISIIDGAEQEMVDSELVPLQSFDEIHVIKIVLDTSLLVGDH